MQSPSLFVDLRQPAHRPDFENVRCLRQLERAHIEWLALQDGFAGEIRYDGPFVEWQRHIDLHPMMASPDVGRCWFEGDMMLEEGRDTPYIERWHRRPRAPHTCDAIALRDATTGRAGIIVRAGHVFMYARARAFDLAPHSKLLEHIQSAAALHAAQNLIDCEISAGRIGPEGWRIEHSSLPFKERQNLAPLWDGSERLMTTDLAPDGQTIERRWEITRVQGVLTGLLA